MEENDMKPVEENLNQQEEKTYRQEEQFDQREKKTYQQEEEQCRLEERDLQLLEESRNYVYTIGRWQMFFAVLLTIGVAMMFLIGLVFFTPVFSQLSDETFSPAFFSVVGVFYLLIAVLYVIPTVYLYRSSSAARDAARWKDNSQATEFLKNNKSFWKYSGIVTISMFVLYVLFFIGIIVVLLASESMF